jgi:hypothetical protein
VDAGGYRTAVPDYEWLKYGRLGREQEEDEPAPTEPVAPVKPKLVVRPVLKAIRPYQPKSMEPAIALASRNIAQRLRAKQAYDAKQAEDDDDDAIFLLLH